MVSKMVSPSLSDSELNQRERESLREDLDCCRVIDGSVLYYIIFVFIVNFILN